MRRRGFGKAALAVLSLFWLTPRPARASGWADSLFRESGHDFGRVPRGAKVRHTFLLTNRLPEPVSIVDVRASCGCTSGRALASVVGPGQSAGVEAEMDTRNFVGRKETVLYVTVVSSSGRQGEVRLRVGSTILSDLVLNPGTVNFGVLDRGQTPSQVLTIDRVGSPSWRVERMVSACKGIDATLTETARNGAAVSYRLTVNIRPDAAAGQIRDAIRLLSNDPEVPVTPVQVTATIRGALTASPASLSLGSTASSGTVQGRYLIRSSRPFAILGFEGEGDGFRLSAEDRTAKPLHIVTLTFAPEASRVKGQLAKRFLVKTDLAGEPPVELRATVHAAP